MIQYTPILAILILLPLSIQTQAATINWQKVAEGLDYATHKAPQKSSHGDSTITILRIDPAKYDFHLYSAKEKAEQLRKANQWGKRKKLIALINAGMYHKDYGTNLGFMKDYDFINNPNLNKDNAIAAFNPKDKNVPPFQIIDRTCQDWETLKQKYYSFTQSIRMVDCKQNNKWSLQPKKWSIAALGQDKEGNALFIFSRSPYAVHEFVKMLLGSPLNLHNLMYLEGGPEASFYLNHNGFKVEKMGSYETGFNENDNNRKFWQIPNIIGITKKQ